MKKYLFSAMLVLFSSILFAGHKPKNIPPGKAKHYVKVKPDKPQVVVVPKPGPKHVWKEGYWVWVPASTRYDWVPGAWVVPPSQYKVWVPGHWKKTRLGWTWVNGHWK